jgi:hypothetical protein
MSVYHRLAETLATRQGEIPALRAVAGFDGFVDEMIQVVGTRRGIDDFTPMRSIADFAGWAAAAAGRSGLREIVVHREDAGGCAINCADGLAALGVGVELFATVGAPPHRAFAPVLARLAAVHPLGEVYGRTLALEFADGKLMLPAVAQLAALDVALAQHALLAGAFPAACARARLIALTNWTLYPHMTAVWGLIAEQVFSRLTQRPAIILDLVDPGGRSSADIRAMLAVLPSMARAADATLGVNLNEANALARLLGVATGIDDASLAGLAGRLQAAIGVQVVVHALHFAATADATVRGPWTATPVKLTGAGDRFNAGYGLGLMLGLPADQRLALGCATSGSFVRAGASAGLSDIIAASRGWGREGL